MNKNTDKESKYWKDMFISLENEEKEIISKDKPVEYNERKNINFIRGVKSISDIEEICNFINKQNVMSSGNTTLLKSNQLKSFLKFNCKIITMKGGNNNSLLGSILSIILPIQCKYKNKTEIINHGCTTYLTVADKLRGFGLCMGLIRELTKYAYEEGIYCDYHNIEQKIGNNSIQLSKWYRPINLKRSIELGFIFPDYDNQRSERKIKLRYKIDLPKNCALIELDNNNCLDYLDYYYKLIENKKFAFYPDQNIWKQWINEFFTYIVIKDDINVGIFSLTPIYCKMKGDLNNKDGKLAFPLLCNGDMNYVLPSLLYIAKQNNYDTFYTYCYGDLTKDSLINIKCIQTDNKSWFGLYNNGIILKEKDISVPLL